jgi:acyl-CoA thioesterase-1
MYFIKIHLALLLAFTCCVQYSFANNTAESTKRLLILGDSLTAGYGLAAEEAFPAQLEEALLQSGRNVSVINAGVSGDTSAGGLARLDWALQDDPQMVIVALGGNDALRGLPPEETFANLDAILERLKVAGIHVILIGMKAPRNLGESYTTAFDQIYPRLAQKHNVGFYPFFLDGVALDPALNQNDGIHPNARGIALIVERILPLVESALMAMP